MNFYNLLETSYRIDNGFYLLSLLLVKVTSKDYKMLGTFPTFQNGDVPKKDIRQITQCTYNKSKLNDFLKGCPLTNKTHTYNHYWIMWIKIIKQVVPIFVVVLIMGFKNHWNLPMNMYTYSLCKNERAHKNTWCHEIKTSWYF